MVKKISLVVAVFVSLTVLLSMNGFAQDKIPQVAIDTFRSQVRLPQGAEIQFVDKKESPIPEFYVVKLLIVLPDKEVPVAVYVDKSGDKVFLGNLFVRGENVTMKEAGPPYSKKQIWHFWIWPNLPLPEQRKPKLQSSNFQILSVRTAWTRGPSLQSF